MLIQPESKICRYYQNTGLALPLLAILPAVMGTQQGKIKKGLRPLKRNQIPILAYIPKAHSNKLITLGLAYQIYAVVKDEKLANEAMQVAEKNIHRNKRTK